MSQETEVVQPKNEQVETQEEVKAETKKKFFEVFANGGQFSRATKDFESTFSYNTMNNIIFFQ